MTAHTDLDRGLEAALARTQADVEEAARTAAALTRELKRARAAASTGQVRDLRKALDSAVEQARQLATAAQSAQAGYDVDERELLASGAYTKELLAAAAESGLDMFEEDDRLLCYPSVVGLLPGEPALEVDRRRERRLRPSVVVALLAKAQQAGPRFKAEPFLASLAAGYDHVVAKQHKQPGAVVRLVEVYGLLTLLPGQARDYSKPEFTRDLYLLDHSGVTVTTGRDRRRLRWAASSGTRQSGVLSTVARSGQQQLYWGIAFEEAGDE